MDVAALKRTWAAAGALGDQVPLYFYSHLFLSHPELRELFPISMAAQRDRLVGALGRIVSSVDELDHEIGFIEQLGRDHRRFAVVAQHYDAVGASLLATLERFLGPEWTPQLAADWAQAYGIIARTMVIAAEESEETSPAWWDAEVISKERRTLDLAVLQVLPDPPLDYLPGQSLAVEIPQRQRQWRYLSPANAPRPDNTIELHAQIVPGGQVSGALVRAVKPGDTVKVGAPIGEQLVLPDTEPRDLVMIAGGTGLAPMLSLVDGLWQRRREQGGGPSVQLFHGARYPWNLYEHNRLTALAEHPWFDYTPVVSDDPTYHGHRGMVGEVAADPRWVGRLAMVCGSPPMVGSTAAALRSAGFDESDIRYEQFGAVDETSHSPHPQIQEHQ
ncbi:globin domain-containing protein [Nakamurella lactea]|uniref:globin domain-containing protein n=1 Tax=Nakamurella lactea TaxID=459515 RepID=UPI0004020436|nr:globin domain-containing protein [Nakamurella lactea]